MHIITTIKSKELKYNTVEFTLKIDEAITVKLERPVVSRHAVPYLLVKAVCKY